MVDRFCARGNAYDVFRGLEKRVAPSTAEAEYVALADFIKEAMYTRYMWIFNLTGFGPRCIRVSRITRGWYSSRRVRYARRTRSILAFATSSLESSCSGESLTLFPCSQRCSIQTSERKPSPRRHFVFIGFFCGYSDSYTFPANLSVHESN